MAANLRDSRRVIKNIVFLDIYNGILCKIYVNCTLNTTRKLNWCIKLFLSWISAILQDGQILDKMYLEYFKKVKLVHKMIFGGPLS